MGKNIQVFLRWFMPVLLIAAVAVWALPDKSESACGAAASSCKNCHEVKGEMRVNKSGDYHTQHSFGDFCVFCHSGNTAATGKAEAHEGMVKPLADLEQSCASCHPDDFAERAKSYGAK
jgi:formate-dependent nitrite reductase cytochrome c552 subunit